MAAKRRRRRTDDNRVGKICISLIILIFGAVMSFKILQVYEKDQKYIAQEAALREQLADEEARAEELKEMENYTKSQNYIEDIAKTKLGLAYDNEIIFKETK